MCITLLQCLEYPGYKFLTSNKLNKAEFSSTIGPNSPGMWSEFSKAIRPNSLLVRVLQNPLKAIDVFSCGCVLYTAATVTASNSGILNYHKENIRKTYVTDCIMVLLYSFDNKSSQICGLKVNLLLNKRKYILLTYDHFFRNTL